MYAVVSDSFAAPWTVAHQAPLSMGFSRQEYWSALPFSSLGDLPNPGIKLRFATLQEDSLPAEPPGYSKNIGVGSLSLLQRIFLTQESNRGLLHCRSILYQLSNEGSPFFYISAYFLSVSMPLQRREWYKIGLNMYMIPKILKDQVGGGNTDS